MNKFSEKSDYYNALIGRVATDKKSGQKALYAAKAFDKGEVLCQFSARKMLSEPDKYTIQIAAKQHIYLEPEILQYINHSCNPNIFFDTNSMKIIALKNIMVGEELTFFYPSTEWLMSNEFDCLCGNDNCCGKIAGAHSLNIALLQRYRLAAHIETQLNLTKSNNYDIDFG